MSDETYLRREEVTLYIDHAGQMLEAATHNMVGDFYATAVNRAYYAIFYAANAVLRAKGIKRSKHSGVISAFREQFVKPAIVETEYSRIYGRVMEHRHVSDYDLDLDIGIEQAQEDVNDAEQFVQRMKQWLQQEGWL